MKNTISFLMGVVLATSLSCDSFTDVDIPSDQLTAEGAFRDPVTATAALGGVYANLRETGMFSGNQDGLSFLMGLYSDEFTYHGAGAADPEAFYTNALLPSNNLVASLWGSAYSRIYGCNAVIEGVAASSELEQQLKDRLTGEALFLRATLHFYLAQLYGDIPYITRTDYSANAQIGRSGHQDAMAFAIADLQQAVSLLPEGYPTGERIRANKYAALAMLARLALYTGDFALAAQSAGQVIDNTAYSIPEDLTGTFLKESPSAIWQLHPGIAGANTNDARNFIAVSAPPAIISLSTNLVEAFEPGDLRLSVWTGNVTDGTSVFYFPYKYKQNTPTAVSLEYSIILRLEEQHLIRAEARIRTGDLKGAKQDIDVLRLRAGLQPMPMSDQETMLAALHRERRVELFSELGHRWFDLKRSGQAGPVLSPVKAGWQATDVLLPIPEKDLLLNPGLQPQNPGY